MLKKVITAAALSVFSLLLLIGVLEAGMRVVGYQPRQYVTQERYRDMNKLYFPNSEGRWYGPLGKVVDFENVVRTNSMALHDTEHAIKKPEGVFRILVLGDSFVEAWQVDLDKTFFKLLENRLGSKVEVISIGNSGNGAVRARILLEQKGLQFDPDLVIAFWTEENDFHDDFHYVRRMTNPASYNHVNLKPANSVFEKLKFYEKLLIFKSSRVNQWLAFLVTEIRTKNIARKSPKVWDGNLGLYGVPGSKFFEDDDTDWEKAFLITAGNHVRMKELSQVSGAKYAVVFVNTRINARRMKALFRDYPGLEQAVDFSLPNKRMRMVLNRNHIPFLDLTPIFDAYTKKNGKLGHFDFDGHWNEDGHALTASALEQFLYNESLIPKNIKQ